MHFTREAAYINVAKCQSIAVMKDRKFINGPKIQ